MSQSKVAYSMPESPFVLPPELIEVKDLVRRIVDEECIPLESTFLADNPEWERGGIGGESLVDGTLPAADWKRLRTIAAETGLDTATLPVEYGGMGYGILGSFVIAEELNRTIIPFPRAFVMGPLYSGNEEQQQKYLLPSMRGELSGCYAQTEPDAGSDPGAMTTRAVLDGDTWVINGTKTFISGAHRADFHLLLAVTDPEKRQRGGITMFIVDSDTPGISLQPLRTWQSSRPHQFTVTYDNVRVAPGQVIGEVGGGFGLGQQFLAIQDRLSRGSLACGFLSRSLDLAVDYVQQRRTFGKPLSERQAIQWMLVDVLLDLKSIRAVSYETAALADRGEDVRAYAAMSKLMGANWGHRSMDKIMQIFGGLGEAMDFPIPHWYHQIRHGRIGGGTDEIQRILIQRAIFSEGKSLWQA
ncbi:acyl-CoA dehydrogenase family protein [Blastococcus sp. URHD0036]|uniref:acyl-CoA dehydrogenase family protein n=1 Tax=Blastococcus sp. URHD0036 TaxID=1380356 RepID=UPI00068D9D72|nr:acyl-CoA dehydrogenase family protein [Blastococcus sp. URHD0036]